MFVFKYPVIYIYIYYTYIIRAQTFVVFHSRSVENYYAHPLLQFKTMTSKRYHQIYIIYYIIHMTRAKYSLGSNAIGTYLLNKNYLRISHIIIIYFRMPSTCISHDNDYFIITLLQLYHRYIGI